MLVILLIYFVGIDLTIAEVAGDTALAEVHLSSPSLPVDKSVSSSFGGLILSFLFGGLLSGAAAFWYYQTLRQEWEKKIDQSVLRWEEQIEVAENARELAEEALQKKSQFLAFMSHEIRTPMNGVMGIAQVLKDSCNEPEQKRLAKTIIESGEALLTVINDILDYSKLEAGKVEIESIKFRLDELLDDCVSIFSTLSLEKRVDLFQVVQEDVPVHLVGDPTRLKQVLINYLSNAFKFTAEGHILIQIRVLRSEGNKLMLKFSVTDTGAGLTQEQLENLFEVYGQADASITRKYGGTGLGLAICKELVSHMGGEVGVDSLSGSGSLFWFTVQLNRLSSDGVETKESNSGDLIVIAVGSILLAQSIASCCTRAGRSSCIIVASQTSDDQLMALAPTVLIVDDNNYWVLERGIKRYRENCRLRLVGCGPMHEDFASDGEVRFPLTNIEVSLLIEDELKEFFFTDEEAFNDQSEEGDSAAFNALVVEDNSVNQMVVKTLLRKLNGNVFVAENGQEAVDVFKDNPKGFDIVLMDCDMPVMDGFEATHQIREFERFTDREPTLICGLSAHASDEYKNRGLDAGMNNYLTKPIRKDEIVGYLKQRHIISDQ